MAIKIPGEFLREKRTKKKHIQHFCSLRAIEKQKAKAKANARIHTSCTGYIGFHSASHWFMSFYSN